VEDEHLVAECGQEWLSVEAAGQEQVDVQEPHVGFNRHLALARTFLGAFVRQTYRARLENARRVGRARRRAASVSALLFAWNANPMPFGPKSWRTTLATFDKVEKIIAVKLSAV
jgi:hypothetical protein